MLALWKCLINVFGYIIAIAIAIRLDLPCDSDCWVFCPKPIKRLQNVLWQLTIPRHFILLFLRGVLTFNIKGEKYNIYSEKYLDHLPI